MIASKDKNSQKLEFPLIKPRLGEREKVEWLIAELSRHRGSLVYKEGDQLGHPFLGTDNLFFDAKISSDVNPYRPHPLHQLLEKAYGALADSLDFDHYPNWSRPNVNKAVKAAYEDAEQEFPPRFFIWTLAILFSIFFLGWCAGYEQARQDISPVRDLQNTPTLTHSSQPEN